MAYSLDDVKLALYELFNDAAEKVRKTESSYDRQQYLQQAFQTVDKIVEIETKTKEAEQARDPVEGRKPPVQHPDGPR